MCSHHVLWPMRQLYYASMVINPLRNYSNDISILSFMGNSVGSSFQRYSMSSLSWQGWPEQHNSSSNNSGQQYPSKQGHQYGPSYQDSGPIAPCHQQHDQHKWLQIQGTMHAPYPHSPTQEKALQTQLEGADKWVSQLLCQWAKEDMIGWAELQEE
jgi:hypothetical protein